MTKGKLQKILPPVITAVVALFVPMMGFNNYVLTIFCQAMLYSVIVLGLNFITGLSGQMNMGNAAVFGLGAYTYALLTTKTDMDPWLAMVFVVFMGWLIGILLGYPSLRVKGVYLSLTTIAFNEIVRQLLQNLKFTNGVNGIRSIPPLHLFGIEIDSVKMNYYFFFIVLVLFILISIRYLRSKYGRAFIAVRDNVDAIEACGINLASIKVKAFVLSTVFGAIAGGLYAGFMGYVAPSTYSTNLSISFVVMLILGGRGSITGCLLGTFIIAFAPELLRFLGNYYQFVYAVLIMLAIIFNPSGLVSLGSRIKMRINRKDSSGEKKKA